MSYKSISPIPISQGGTAAQTLTQHGVLLGQGTSAITAVTGTAGNVLTANSAADPTYQTITSSSVSSIPGVRILIQSQSVSGTPTTLSFTSGITGYTYYEIEILNYLGSASSSFTLLVSTDGGVSWQGTSYNYAGATVTDNATLTATGAAGQANIVLGTTFGHTANTLTGNGKIRFFNLTSGANYNAFIDNFGYGSSTPRLTMRPLTGGWNNITVVNGIQFKVSSGTMTQGTFRLFGIV